MFTHKMVNKSVGAFVLFLWLAFSQASFGYVATEVEAYSYDVNMELAFAKKESKVTFIDSKAQYWKLKPLAFDGYDDCSKVYIYCGRQTFILNSDTQEKAQIGHFFAFIGDFIVTKGADKLFDIHPRVAGQLNDPRMGALAGKLSPDDLQRLANNLAAQRVFDARSGNINVIQDVEGKLLRITVPRDEMKIISVGPIRPNQVTNRIESGDFIPLP